VYRIKLLEDGKITFDQVVFSEWDRMRLLCYLDTLINKEKVYEIVVEEIKVKLKY
jgi:hypothetical protein